MGLRRRSPPGADSGRRLPGEPLPADLECWLDAHFAPAERAAAQACLQGAMTGEGRAAGVRLLRCAALASHGELAQLQKLVERLRVDWRDVVVEGEYAVRKGKLVRVRDLSLPLDAQGNPDR